MRLFPDIKITMKCAGYRTVSGWSEVFRRMQEQKRRNFLRLRKSKFEGKLERSLELLKLFIDRGERQENELRKQEEEVDREILTMEKNAESFRTETRPGTKKKACREQARNFFRNLRKHRKRRKNIKMQIRDVRNWDF